jgi:hypothetical protein
VFGFRLEGREDLRGQQVRHHRETVCKTRRLLLPARPEVRRLYVRNEGETLFKFPIESGAPSARIGKPADRNGDTDHQFDDHLRHALSREGTKVRINAD